MAVKRRKHDKKKPTIITNTADGPNSRHKHNLLMHSKSKFHSVITRLFIDPPPPNLAQISPSPSPSPLLLLLLLLLFLPALCEASGALQPPERGPHRRDVVGLPCLSCPGAVYAAGHLEAGGA